MSEGLRHPPAWAFTKFFFERKWDEAREGFEEAIAINPNYPVARMGHAHYLISQGRCAQAPLRLWRDAHHDGISQAEELHTLRSLDVARIHLNYKESRRADGHGNRFRYRAKVDDARGAKANRWAWDVFLVAQ